MARAHGVGRRLPVAPNGGGVRRDEFGYADKTLDELLRLRRLLLDEANDIDWHIRQAIDRAQAEATEARAKACRDADRIVRKAERHAEWIRTGAKVQRARRSRGLTQQGLSDETGIPRGSIAMIESGGQRPTAEQAKTLADALALDFPEVPEAV